MKKKIRDDDYRNFLYYIAMIILLLGLNLYVELCFISVSFIRSCSVYVGKITQSRLRSLTMGSEEMAKGKKQRDN